MVVAEAGNQRLVQEWAQTLGSSQALSLSLHADTQFNFMTQPPNVLGATEAGNVEGIRGDQHAIDTEGRGDSTLEVLVTRRQAEQGSSFATADENLPLDRNAQGDATGRQRRRAKDKQLEGPRLGSAPVTTSNSTLPLRGPETETVLASENTANVLPLGAGQGPCKADAGAGSPSTRLLELTAIMPRIPPEAFRSLICHGSDDKVASIMEKQHPLVRDFLRARGQAAPTKPANKAVSRRGGAVQAPVKRPLLERHESAERMVWPPSRQPSPATDRRTDHSQQDSAPDRSTVTPTVKSNAWPLPSSFLSPLPGEHRRRRKWSEDETTALIRGYTRYGPDWRHILRTYGHHFDHRSNVDLKDRARILRKQGFIK